MPVPFKVKAVYEYRSEEPDDLIFDNGQIITVTEDDDEDWYTGEYTTVAGEKKDGIFPRNFVEKFEPAVPSRPARAAKKAPQLEPVATAVAEPDPPVPAPVVETASSPPIAPRPSVHEPATDARVEPPTEVSDSAPAPTAQEPLPATVAAAAEPKPAPSAKKEPPPVTEKPSSFRDRIAAFNKPAAAPIAPFKPSGSSTGFIKKPFVPPPPSRNAYVPPPREQPPPKVYRREDEPEPESSHAEAESERRPSATSERAVAQEEDDQPRTETLKERIARLQQQQLETAQRQADSSKRKDRPKRPAKARTESVEAPVDAADESTDLQRVSTEKVREPLAQPPVESEDERPVRRSTDKLAAATPPMPSRELVSDTNDADDSGAGDTEDAQDISTEEERPKAVASPPVIAQKPSAADEVEEDEEDTEEEEDPEIRRKRELRERMAKMSGGMGMMGMFGGGPGVASASAKKPKPPTRKDDQPDPVEEEESQRAPPVPIMALPGMSRPPPKAASPPHSDEEEDDSAQPTPVATQGVGPTDDDYITQQISRKSTDRSQPMSARDRPPPPLPEDKPQPPHSPGARPVPPPPPTKHGDLPTTSRHDDSDDDDDELTSASVPPPISTATGPRAVPPPPPHTQVPSIAGQSRPVPPLPMSPTSPHSRPPPPPPPGQAPPRRVGTDVSLHLPARDDSEDEVTEYDGDYDTDIASSAKHKAALKSHNRDSSFDEGALSDEGAPPAGVIRTGPPQIPNNAPRDVPPPPPSSTRPRESMDAPRAMPPPIPPPQSMTQPRQSVESPRGAPPPIPPAKSPMDEGEYDPYRYSAPPPAGLPGMVANLRRTTEEFENDYSEDRDVMPAPPERSAPPLPSGDRAAPPPPPPQQAPSPQEPNETSMSGALVAPPKRSVELGRSNSRRSADVARPSMEHTFIATDVDLAQASMWYTKENMGPPILQNRNDVLWEVESSTSQKRGGRTSVSRDVYVLYQDYSQTTINATYDASEPGHVSFEQSHERPPMPPRKDQLEGAWENFGAQISNAAEKANGATIGEGSAHEFVLSLIRPLSGALLPVGTRAYGALVYANLANASTQQFDEIRPGDIVTFRNVKFAGHKGGLHQKYSQEAAMHVAVVLDWDGTKKKIRAWEQGNQEKGKKAKVREESYRVSDLKSGEVRVWRVMPRSFVNWGTA